MQTYTHSHARAHAHSHAHICRQTHTCGQRDGQTDRRTGACAYGRMQGMAPSIFALIQS